MAKKPSTPTQRQQKIAEKRIICFEKFLNAAFNCSRDFFKQKLVFATLGISFLLALKEINGDITGVTEIAWLLGNIFFASTIAITLYANKEEIKYNSRAVHYYYIYDDPEEKEAQAEENEINKLRDCLVKVEWAGDFCFLFGIGCAIIFTWLS